MSDAPNDTWVQQPPEAAESGFPAPVFEKKRGVALKQGNVPLDFSVESFIVVSFEAELRTEQNGEVNLATRGQSTMHRRLVLNGMRSENQKTIRRHGIGFDVPRLCNAGLLKKTILIQRSTRVQLRFLCAVSPKNFGSKHRSKLSAKLWKTC
jgi:hypothetical protein